jgi:hypothetical protein
MANSASAEVEFVACSAEQEAGSKTAEGDERTDGKRGITLKAACDLETGENEGNADAEEAKRYDSGVRALSVGSKVGESASRADE